MLGDILGDRLGSAPQCGDGPGAMTRDRSGMSFSVFILGV
jgi:hypothetical protein